MRGFVEKRKTKPTRLEFAYVIRGCDHVRYNDEEIVIGVTSAEISTCLLILCKFNDEGTRVGEGGRASGPARGIFTYSIVAGICMCRFD